MNKEQKAEVVEEVARELSEAGAVFAVDYRGISVKQAADLRAQLADAGARFRVVKNRLTLRAADEAGAEDLKQYLEGPTALTFVFGDGDAALAAKALAAFRRENGLPDFKGGSMEGQPLTAAEIEALSRLPARDVLYNQLVGVTASPLTGLVRTLNALISGLAAQLGQIRDQGLVEGEPAADEGGEPAASAEAAGAGEGETDEESSDEGGDSDDGGTGSDDSGGDSDDSGDDGDSDSDESGEDGDSDGDPVSEAELTQDQESEAVVTADTRDDDSDEEVATAGTGGDESADDPSVMPAEEAPGDPVAEAETAQEESGEDGDAGADGEGGEPAGDDGAAGEDNQE